MILPDVRQAALEEVRRALEEELRDDSPLIGQRAENLVAIAVEYRVDITKLLDWIHLPAPRKQWSAAEWRRWCQMYVDEARRVSDPREEATE